MRGKNRYICLGLALVLLLSLTAPAVSAQDGPEAESVVTDWKQITINSTDDYFALADSCTMDTASLSYKVTLMSDLDFTGLEFRPIPFFSGIFNGNNHTISGISDSTAGSYRGVFRYIGEQGTVRSLNVRGSFTPSGTATCVGGIAGENRGSIISCRFYGTVAAMEKAGGIAGVNTSTGTISGSSFLGNITGEHSVGGIAGVNDGRIVTCKNTGAVNNVRITTSGEFHFDIASFSEDDFLNITDIGGIAGVSSGSIEKCVNSGNVGYYRMGYNVGGIAGRSNGFINGCVNLTEVDGRKDVGGIAGQLEPYTYWDLSKSKLEELNEAMTDLQDTTDRVLTNVDGYNAELQAAILDFSTSLDAAVYELNLVMSSTSDGLGALSDAFSQIQAIVGEESGSDTPDTPVIPDIPDIPDIPGAPDIPDVPDIPGISDTTDALDKLGRISDVLSGVTLTIPQFDMLTVAMSGLVDSGMVLSQALTKYMNGLTGDLADLAEQMDKVYSSFTSTAQYMADMEDIDPEDISADQPYSFEIGVISGCSSSSEIKGETNVGGIAGSIAVEYSFDIADELQMSDYILTDAKYLIYAVVRSCESQGEISASKQAAGGIIGLMDFGAAIGCTAAGSISTEDGDCCGGIAGESSGAVTGCSSRVLLSGNSYVGGITGLGNTVSSCRAYAFINSASEYYGTVAGSVTGECSGNTFVQNGTNGIDNISYAGVAEPVSYETMVNGSGVPDIFKGITVTFMGENGVLKTQEVPFGGTVETLPEVPMKGEMYWKWDDFDNTHIYYSITVQGRYCNPITVLSDGKDIPDILVQGSFYEGQTLELLPYSPDLNKLKREAADIITALTIRVSDCRDEITVCMRARDGGTLYLLNTDGSFRKADYTADGSYIVFSGPNGLSAVYTVSQTDVWVYFAAGTALFVALLVLVTVLARKRRRRKSMQDLASDLEADSHSDTATDFEADSHSDTATDFEADSHSDTATEPEPDSDTAIESAPGPDSDTDITQSHI